ncbi:MAG: type II toxin-antitoxin system Phd/YefM family antitoxin [Solirubrobacteraceae bacterium]
MATVQMGIRELRDNLTAAMRRVRSGETIEVTHRGQPVATIAPVAADRLARLVASGDVTPAKPDATIVGRRFRAVGALSASQALEDDRADR